MDKKICKTTVLGGGLAGLSAAYYGNFPVYEANQKPGGTADSIHKDGFTFDIGIHVLHSRNQQFYDLLRKLDVELISHKRKAWIYSYGSYSFYPFQVNTSHLSLLHRMKCVAGYLLRKKHSKLENYENWMIQNFGNGFAKTFLIPYAEKFWRISPKEMTYEWTDLRIPQPDAIEVLKGAIRNKATDLGPNAEFHYPTKCDAGFSAIANSLAAKINNVYCEMKATSIDPNEKIISFNDGKTRINYDYLISTIPLPELVDLFPAVPQNIQNSVSQLRCNSIAVVNIGVAQPNISEKHWIHFPGKDISFFRICFPSNFCTSLSPAKTSSIQAEVSYNKQNVPEKNELVRQVRNDLIKAGILKSEDRVDFEDVIYLNYGYVIYDRHRKDAVQKIHAFLNNFDIYPCGRYGNWEYLWSDEAMLSGKKTAETVLELRKKGKFSKLVG